MLFRHILNVRYVWLVIASLIAGVMNAMAGGGSFVSFPAMLGMGIPPVQANATNTVALWPGQLTSLATMHGDLRKDLLPPVLAACLVGGITGAEVLLHTRQRTFLHLIPWLILGGTLLFGISGPVSKWIRRRSAEPHQPRKVHMVSLTLVMLPLCFYVGYFGAGGGFLLMTALALFGVDDMHQLNAMKVLAATASNLCAICTFILSGFVMWHYCIVSLAFAGLGGYIGARFAKRTKGEWLRAIVVGTGLVVSGYFFWKQAQA